MSEIRNTTSFKIILELYTKKIQVEYIRNRKLLLDNVKVHKYKIFGEE